MSETTTEVKRCGCRVYRNRQPEGFTVVALVCDEARRLKAETRDSIFAARDAAELALQKHVGMKPTEWKP